MERKRKENEIRENEREGKKKEWSMNRGMLDKKLSLIESKRVELREMKRSVCRSKIESFIM